MCTLFRRWRCSLLDVLFYGGFVLLFVFAQHPAFAQSTATVTQYYTQSIITQTGNATGWQNSAVLACQASYNQSLGYYQTNQPGFAPYTGNIDSTSPNCVYWIKDKNGGLIGNKIWTFTYTTQSASAPLGCPAAGETRFVNFTLGFTDDPQLSKSATVNTYADKFQSLLASGGTCASGAGSACAVTIANDTASLGNAWISASPTSQGLYRVSQDYKVTYTGATCTLTADQKMLTESTDAAPACSGVYGTVNGKGVCVPSGTANRNVLQPIGNSPRKVGNPAAGSNAGLPISARTPTAGSGANDGGPVTPLDGTPAPVGAPLPSTPGSSSGGGLSPSDIPAACGAPGQPACKMDETGTPSPVAESAYDAKVDSVRSTVDQNRGVISGAGDKGFFSEFTLFFSAPPVVLCEPMPLPDVKGVSMGAIDPCGVVNGVRSMMGYLWAIAALFLSLKMIRQVL